MRIAQFIDTESRGGAERIFIDNCRRLRASGHTPLALHFGSRHLAAECERHGIRQQIVPGHRQYKKTATLARFAWQFAGLLREQRIEVLHSHLFGPVTGAAPAARLAGIPHVGTLHDVYSIGEKPRRIRLLQLAAVLGTRLVAVSRQMEAYYRSQGRFAAGALRTIHNGIDPLPPTRSRRSVRRLLNLAEDEPVVICVGRLVPLKRHDLLIDAFHRLPGADRARLLLVGDGPCRERLQRQIAALGLARRVRLLGARDDVPDLLAAADVFCLSSDTEGLSCSILEAMAAGLPAVVTAVGGNAELVRDGQTGFIVPPGDAATLALRLEELLGDPLLRQRYAHHASRRVRSHFSAAGNLRQYLLLYQGHAEAAA